MREEDQTRRLHTQYAYIDTSSFEEEDFDWRGRSISRLTTLVNAREINLLITDITKREVNRRLGKHLNEIDQQLRTVKSGIMNVLQRFNIQPISSPSSVKRELIKEFNEFVENHSFLPVELTNDINTIVHQHFEVQPPFSSKKPNEFNDAVVIQSLREWALIKNQKVYLVAKDSDWENCCSEESPFIYRNSIDALVSDAKHLTQSRKEIKQYLIQNQGFMEELFRLIRTLPITVHLPTSSGHQAEEVQLVNVGKASSNYFDLEVVDMDNTTNSLVCTIRLEASLNFEVSENVYATLYAEEFLRNILQKSQNSKRYRMFSEEIFRAEIKISGFNPKNSERTRISDVQLITPSIRTRPYSR